MFIFIFSMLILIFMLTEQLFNLVFYLIMIDLLNVSLSVFREGNSTKIIILLLKSFLYLSKLVYN